MQNVECRMGIDFCFWIYFASNSFFQNKSYLCCVKPKNTNMKRGKQTCKILKEIRKQIAAENDIKLVVSECTYQGDCLGTCPKCEAEVRYLEHELEKRQRLGKAAVFAGMTIGTAITAASCGPFAQPPNGMLVGPEDTITATTDTVRNDSVDEPFEFEGDVMSFELDTIEEEDDVTPGLIAIEDEWVDGPDENGVYMIVDEMPEFPGGDRALMDFIKDSIQYPADARKRGIQGRVFANFIVEPDGSLSDIKILRGIGGGCDEEAIRVIESMPKFIPGMQNGEAVRVSYTIPVIFRLQ